MPAKSAKQQRFMGAALARALRKPGGKDPQTGMSAGKLREMAAKPSGGYSEKRK